MLTQVAIVASVLTSAVVPIFADNGQVSVEVIYARGMEYSECPGGFFDPSFLSSVGNPPSFTDNAQVGILFSSFC